MLLVSEVVPKVSTSKPIPILLFEPFVVMVGSTLLPKAIFLKVVVADINEPDPIAIRFCPFVPVPEIVANAFISPTTKLVVLLPDPTLM